MKHTYKVLAYELVRNIMAKRMEPIRKGQVLRNIRFGHCDMIIFGPMKLKKYQVDLPARIFKKFARGETDFSFS